MVRQSQDLFPRENECIKQRTFAFGFVVVVVERDVLAEPLVLVLCTAVLQLVGAGQMLGPVLSHLGQFFAQFQISHLQKRTPSILKLPRLQA